jgi:hypothetical protein
VQALDLHGELCQTHSAENQREQIKRETQGKGMIIVILCVREKPSPIQQQHAVRIQQEALSRFLLSWKTTMSFNQAQPSRTFPIRGFFPTKELAKTS